MQKIIKNALTVALGAFVLWGTTAAEARAGSLAFGIPEASPPGYISSPLGTDGFVFTPNTDIVVTALDYYLSPYSPTSGSLIDGHPVGIYDVTGSHIVPLVQTTVGPGSSPVVGNPPATSQFISQAITPITLFAGQSYMLAGLETPDDNQNGADSSGTGIPVGSIFVAPDLALNAYYYDYGLSLVYPTTPYGTTFWGPNFEFTPTPEPSSLVLVAMGLVGFAVWGWRRKH